MIIPTEIEFSRLNIVVMYSAWKVSLSQDVARLMPCSFTHLTLTDSEEKEKMSHSIL